MTLKLSAAARNYALQNGSLRKAFNGGKLLVYTGTQPATAEAAPTGTLLVTYTNASGAHTSEVLATGNITLTTGAAGSVDTLTVDGVDILTAAVPFNTSLTQTAADVAAMINNNSSEPEYTAVSGGAVVTITANRGAGTEANGLVVTGTLTTLTATYGNMAGGVNSANGLRFSNASGGVLIKDASQTWTGVAVADGAALWFRLVGPVADSGILDTTESQIRLDGAVATSGQQLNMSGTTTIANGSTQTISTFPITFPTS